MMLRGSTADRRAVPGTSPSRGVAWERPSLVARTAHSPAIERRIETASSRIADPGLRRLFAGAFSNTLDTTVRDGGTGARPLTFIATGDIDAMWLRDSTAQVWPYLASAPDDPSLDRLLRGIIHRQSDQVLLDPYANAFSGAGRRPSRWHLLDRTEMRTGVHERKWEPDSLAAFLRLSAGYAAATHSLVPFDPAWRGALALTLATLRIEQRRGDPSPYRFRRLLPERRDRLPNGNDVAATRPNGMVHCAFRPSDDACILPLNVPVNLALAAALDAVRPIAAAVGAAELAADAGALAQEIRWGVATSGIVAGDLGPCWAYEIDGLGNALVMDDANVPSLLALPYLGACAPDDPLYRATRAAILSERNPWWFSGRLGDGIGSPHTGSGRIWPIAVAMRGLTATDPAERLACARLLGTSHAGTFLAHEGFDPDDATRYTRPWFAWANVLVGEFLERAALEGLLA